MGFHWYMPEPFEWVEEPLDDVILAGIDPPPSDDEEEAQVTDASLRAKKRASSAADLIDGAAPPAARPGCVVSAVDLLEEL